MLENLPDPTLSNGLLSETGSRCRILIWIQTSDIPKGQDVGSGVLVQLFIDMALVNFYWQIQVQIQDPC